MANPPKTDPLTAARDERERMLRRIAWWEAHRFELLIPVAAVTFGAGYGLGYGVVKAFELPQPYAFYLAAAVLFVAGRAVDRYFSATRLGPLDARIARLERERAKRSP